jgi:hypothetical protein
MKHDKTTKNRAAGLIIAGALCLSISPALVVLVLSVTGARAGGDTCLQGFVWREASSADHVCVTPQTRRETAADNAAALSRINPNGGAFGRFTCLQGFVWREAFNGDTVCVTPATRAQAAADNAQAAQRLAP